MVAGRIETRRKTGPSLTTVLPGRQGSGVMWLAIEGSGQRGQPPGRRTCRRSKPSVSADRSRQV